MIKCLELDRDFGTQREMFLALKENKEAIIELKKSAVKRSHSVAIPEIKSTEEKQLDFLDKGYVFPVINSTNYQDSAKDVHLPGLWNKTLKESGGKYYYLEGHSMKLADIIAWKEDVEAFTETVPWKSIGKDYDGETQLLIFKIAEDKLVNGKAKEAILSKKALENSVSMIYVKMSLAINSEDKEFKEEKAVWDKYYKEVANKEELDKNGYAWYIHEAKIAREGSLVLAGANDATPVLYPKVKTEPPKDTPEEKAGSPLSDSQRAFLKAVKSFINN